MYRFKTRKDSEVTCRRWILDPSGCIDVRCPYVHGMTGYLSPPSAYACYAFNNGGCPKSQDECLYAHLSIGVHLNAQNLSMRYPHLSSQDLRIAQAASDGGFDCNNWPKLRELLIATKRAVQPNVNPSKSNYPDRYNGPAAFQSSIYPDNYRPDAIRPRQGVVEAYRNAARAPSVPAFAKSAQQILKDLNEATNGKRASSPATIVADNLPRAATGTNRTPLAPRADNKRPTGWFVDLTGSDPKRVKTEPSTQQPAGRENLSSNTGIIDLTQDDTTIKQSSSQVPPRLPTIQPAPRTRSRPKSKGGKRPPRPPRPPPPQHVIRRDTSTVFARCASKLRAAAHGLDLDRDSLRERWEIDDELKLQSVTDDLGELNAKFHECQEMIVAATKIIEEKLLRR